MRKSLRTTLCAVAIAAFLPSLASADVVFSDLGPGNTYNCCVGWTVAAGVGAPSVADAMGFTPSADYNFTQIDLGIGVIPGFSSAVFVYLVNDSGGLPGNTFFDSWALGPMPTFGTTDNALVTLTANAPFQLLAGQTYWIWIQPAVPSTRAAWNWNSTGITGLAAQTDANGKFQLRDGTPRGAFDVLGTTVPEPSSFWFAGAGLIGLAIHALSRRRLASIPAR